MSKKFKSENELTTPSLVAPKDGRGVIQEENARTLPPSGIHSIPASLPIISSIDKPNATY